LGEEEVHDRTQTRERQGQAERQGQLLPSEPEGRDAVLNDLYKRGSNVRRADEEQRHESTCVTVGGLLVRDPLPDPNTSRPVSSSGSR